MEEEVDSKLKLEPGTVLLYVSILVSLSALYGIAMLFSYSFQIGYLPKITAESFAALASAVFCFGALIVVGSELAFFGPALVVRSSATLRHKLSRRPASFFALTCATYFLVLALALATSLHWLFALAAILIVGTLAALVSIIQERPWTFDDALSLVLAFLLACPLPVYWFFFAPLLLKSASLTLILAVPLFPCMAWLNMKAATVASPRPLVGLAAVGGIVLLVLTTVGDVPSKMLQRLAIGGFRATLIVNDTLRDRLNLKNGRIERAYVLLRAGDEYCVECEEAGQKRRYVIPANGIEGFEIPLSQDSSP